MPKAPRLQDTIGYALARVCKLHRQRASELLGGVGLHVGQEMMLSVLWDEENVTQTELAERVLVQPATATNALKRLERQGFIERGEDAEDQRISRVRLTENGRGVEGAVLDRWSQLERESFSVLSREERASLRRILQKVYTSLMGKP